jgi:hypothetical protein
MKRSVAWLGSLAVVLVLGFSHYAVADSPPTVVGSLSIGGPLVFQANGLGGNEPTYDRSGGPVGTGTVQAGHTCTQVYLYGDVANGTAVDGNKLFPDYNESVAFVTLAGGPYHGTSVAGYSFLYNQQTDLIKSLRVCLNKRATESVGFSYFIANVSWNG